MDPESSQSSSGLQRGKACLNCRRRKMRCDGEKPICGPCSRRSDDCEYTDRPGPTRTQALEEHITFLENRIRDLEHPSESSSSVFLADPYASQSQAQYSTPSDPSTDLQIGTQQRLTSELSLLPDLWWDLEEPPAQLRQILLDHFLPYIVITGFFLNVPRFINSFYSSGPSGDHTRPSPALLSTVYLWGLKLSSSDILAAYEPNFLARAIRNVNNALSSDHPQKAKHAVQAEVLLSHYFYWCGRYLEGRYHGNAAVSIAISLGFHRIRSGQGSALNIDTIEEGERINAFWTVFLNDKCWSVAMNVPSALPDHKALNGRIDTPWPFEMAQYERGLLTPDIRGYRTVQTFLENPGVPGEGTSLFATACKASALLDRATRFASTWRQNMSQAEVTKFYSDFAAMNQGIDAFYEKIPLLVVSGDVSIHSVRTLIAVHTIACIATIRLNVIFAHQEASANTKCVKAATTIIRLLDDVDLIRLGLVPLFMGNLWLVCGQVLIRETVRLRALRTSSTDVFPLLGAEEELIGLLDRIEFIMFAFGAKAPVFHLQHNILTKTREDQL